MVSFLLFIVPAALADTVILKNGRELRVEKIWQEGDRIFFIFHGMKVVIPQSKISRIESSSDPSDDSFQDKDGPKKPGPAFTKQPHQVPPEPCSALRKDGFCDLQWGRKLVSVDGLEEKQIISDLDGVVEYIRPTHSLNIGNAALKSVIYAFWRDRFYTVTVWTEGCSNYKALRETVFKAFGPGIRNDTTRERYLWSDNISDIMLDYTQDGQYGMLWLRSKELDHQCRSSRLKSHASLLKWMRSRN